MPGLLNDEVLSPSRLRLRVFEKVGAPPLQPLDEHGRMMAISCALHQVKDRLKSYKSTATQLSMPARVS